MPLPTEIAARFRAHYRCLNCEKNTFHAIDVPMSDEAPRDIDELMESAFFASLRFRCQTCEGAIATVVAIKQLFDEEIAA